MSYVNDVSQKVVVTGGLGFIGGHLALQFLNQGCHVTIYDRRIHGEQPWHYKLGHHPHCRVIIADLRNDKKLRTALAGQDIVYHLAARQAIKLTPYLNAFSLAKFHVQLLWGPSNNLSCRKVDFEQLSGFDELSPKPHGSEDVDFGYRLYSQGKLMATCPEAKVYHSTKTWKTLTAVLLRLIRWSRGEAYIVERYWSELYNDCPSRYGCALGLTLVGISIALLSRQSLWLYFPLIFLAFNFAARLFWRCLDTPEYVMQIVQLIAAEVLVLFYETALLFHFVSRDFDLKPLFTCLIIRPEDALANWNTRTIEAWKCGLEIVLSGLIICGWLYKSQQ